MSIYFMEVTVMDKSKYSFRVETLKSFEDMGTYTRIYLDTQSFDIREDYQEFINRLKDYN